MREQLPATAVQALFDFYIDHVALPGTVGAEVEAQFRQMAQRAGLKAKQIDQLISWHRAFAAGVQ